jgi:hypothetical protein
LGLRCAEPWRGTGAILCGVGASYGVRHLFDYLEVSGSLTAVVQTSS